MSLRARHQWLSSTIGLVRRSVTGRPIAGRARPLIRRLRVESLESRRLLANVTVSKLTDVVDGNTTSIAALVGSPGADGGISLREAILTANVDNADAVDTISFAPSVRGTIQLTNTNLAWQLEISSDLTINGPGASLLTIRAFAGMAAVGDGARIFRVDDGNAGTFKNVGISGLTIAGGDRTLSDGSDGGGILNFENLTLMACTVSDNVLSSGGTSRGGGIFSSLGSLSITNCTISGNTARRGGGIFSDSSNATLTDSTISGNTASSTSGDGGGGVLAANVMTISNSTVSNNVTNAKGGGVLSNSSGMLTVRHSTISGNWADADNSSGGEGGGIYSTSAATSLDHTIVAGNLRAASTRDDVSGAVVASSAYNLIGVNTGLTGITNGTNGNQIGTGASPINPMLGILTNNGGPTFTHALLAGSPAIDAGEAGIAAPPANDQRGAPFVRKFDGDGAGGPWIDIGAYESQPDGALGDYNRDDGVTAADYVMWRKLYGTSVTPPFVGADGDGDSTIDAGDYDAWEENFGETLAGSGGAAVRGWETRAQQAEIDWEIGRGGEGEMRFRIADFPPRWVSVSRIGLSRDRNSIPEVGGTDRDVALAAWLDSSASERRDERVDIDSLDGNEMSDHAIADSLVALDLALEGLVAGM